MSNRDVFEDIAALDRLIHEPARLAIATALSACAESDFLYLQRLTGLSKGNLSSHLSKLEAAQLVEIEKTYKGKKPHTIIRLTNLGRERIDEHWKHLDQLRARKTDWTAEDESNKEE